MNFFYNIFKISCQHKWRHYYLFALTNLKAQTGSRENLLIKREAKLEIRHKGIHKLRHLMQAGSLIKTFFKHCCLTTKAVTDRQLKLNSLRLLNVFNRDGKMTLCHLTFCQTSWFLVANWGLGCRRSLKKTYFFVCWK